ncbi:MAG: DUF3142 domain-containing protein [Chthoniobacteraceae bacterium]
MNSLAHKSMALAVLCLVTTAMGGDGVPATYWVWHRTTRLTDTETTELDEQGVKFLYWQAGELTAKAAGWVWSRAPLNVSELAPKRRVIPTVRLESDVSDPFQPSSVVELRTMLRQTAAGGTALQIDYDCPDRLLDRYAETLAELRRDFPQLSITALAHWVRRAEWPRLAAAVSEVAPMFYDLQADPTGLPPLPPPLLDPDQFKDALDPWSRCGIRWRAGLPNFARLTVFDRTGLSRGQIANWMWPQLVFHRHLRAVQPTALGMTAFRVGENTKVARTSVLAGETVVSRTVDRKSLALASRQAMAAGADGIIYFRLPDGTDPAGRSLSDLGALQTSDDPRLELRPCGRDRVALRNVSKVDLPPRLTGARGDRDRGYALEIDAPVPIFREAVAGEFWRVTAHADPDSEKPRAVTIPLATRLTFWFSDLRAGQELRSGLLQFAPNAKLEAVRYRILDTATSNAWTSFVSP